MAPNKSRHWITRLWLIWIHIYFQNQESQAFAFTVEFEAAEKLYGLFDHAYQITLPETVNGSMDPFRLKNVDAYEYEVNSPMALYGSVPVIYGHS